MGSTIQVSSADRGQLSLLAVLIGESVELFQFVFVMQVCVADNSSGPTQPTGLRHSL
jgi:hypothetical protein